MKKNVLIVLILLLFSQTSFAWSWRDLWSRPDEQAAKLLKQGKADMAVKLFQDPKWRAVARYRSGSYQQAAIDFGQQNSATGFCPGFKKTLEISLPSVASIHSI